MIRWRKKSNLLVLLLSGGGKDNGEVLGELLLRDLAEQECIALGSKLRVA
jgi:hypothetical protein